MHLTEIIGHDKIIHKESFYVPLINTVLLLWFHT